MSIDGSPCTALRASLYKALRVYKKSTLLLFEVESSSCKQLERFFI
jgi:hypothetical protein